MATTLYICPDCHNEFLQPFRCVTCGAQHLYDETVRVQAEQNAVLRAAVKALGEALSSTTEWIRNWDPNFIHDEDWFTQAEANRAALALPVVKVILGGER